MNRKQPAEERFPARESRGPPRNVQNFTNAGALWAGYGPVSPELFKKMMIAKDLIERCLQLYMNKKPVIRTVFEQVGIEPNITSGVWDQMTRENAEFFEEYYKKLILIDQIEAFNRLVERQCHLQNLASQKASSAPFREGNQHMPADSPHKGYNIPKMLSNPSNRNQQRSTVFSHDNYGVPAPVLENYRRLMARKGNAPDKVHVSPIVLSEIPNLAPDNHRNISNFSFLFPPNPPTDQQGHGFVDSRLQFPRSSSGHLQRSTVSSNHSEDAASNSSYLTHSEDAASNSSYLTHGEDAASNSSYLTHMKNGGGMALESNAADRTQYFGNHNLTETSYSGAKDRHPSSTSSLPPPVGQQWQNFIEPQWQHFIEPQWHHFMERQGFDWSSARKVYELTCAHENPASTTLIGSQESSNCTISNYHNGNPAPGSFHPAQMNYERGMAMYENEAPPCQIPSPVSVERHPKEYDFILSRDPFSLSSLAPPIEKQGQPSTQQQGQHFMEQQGTGSSFYPAQLNYERGMAMYENEAPPCQIPSPVSVERHPKEYDFILSRDPFSLSSLAPPIEKQGQPSTQQQGQHFMEQQGTGSSFYPAQLNYKRGMATYENEAPPFQIPSPVSVERHLKEYDFILSRDPFSSSSLASLIEKQGQPSAQQQGQHFMEQQGTGSSVQESPAYTTLIDYREPSSNVDQSLNVPPLEENN